MIDNLDQLLVVGAHALAFIEEAVKLIRTLRPGRARAERPASEVQEVKRVDQTSELDRIVRRLHLAGWSIGDVEIRGENGQGVWIVSGRNGSENVIRSEAPTQGEAWRDALGQARSLGLLDGIHP